MNPSVAVVAGAGPGLGRALAQRFIQGGMRVAMLARDPARLSALAASIGPDARPLACDLTEPDAVAAAPRFAAALVSSTWPRRNSRCARSRRAWRVSSPRRECMSRT